MFYENYLLVFPHLLAQDSLCNIPECFDAIPDKAEAVDQIIVTINKQDNEKGDICLKLPIAECFETMPKEIIIKEITDIISNQPEEIQDEIVHPFLQDSSAVKPLQECYDNIRNKTKAVNELIILIQKLPITDQNKVCPEGIKGIEPGDLVFEDVLPGVKEALDDALPSQMTHPDPKIHIDPMPKHDNDIYDYNVGIEEITTPETKVEPDDLDKSNPEAVGTKFISFLTAFIAHLFVARERINIIAKTKYDFQSFYRQGF